MIVCEFNPFMQHFFTFVIKRFGMFFQNIRQKFCLHLGYKVFSVTVVKTNTELWDHVLY